MENAAKALLIAGSVLLGIIVLSIFMLMVNSLTDYQQAQTQIENNQDIVAFNNQFQGYMSSLINKVTYYNKAKASDAIGADDAGNQYVYEPITLVVKMDGKRTQLAMDGSNNCLIKEDSYTFDETSKFNDKLDSYDLKNIESLLNKTYMPTSPDDTFLDEKYQKQRVYYTEGILKGFLDDLNSTDSIFDYENGIFANYVNKPFASLTEYDVSTNIGEELKRRLSNFNLIVGKVFFPLYKKDGTPVPAKTLLLWWKDYLGKSANKHSGTGKSIRNDLQYYYEYAQFQRGKFEFVQPGAGQETYSSNTGRVKYMEFKFTGEFI